VKNLAFLAIAIFFGISVLVSIQPEWFGFVHGVPGRDKLLHFLGVGILSVFIVTGFSPVMVRTRTYGPFSMLIAIALLITIDEFGQIAIPSRTFDLTDLCCSYAGIAVFGLPAIWLKRLQASAS